MNRDRRKDLREAISLLDGARESLESAKGIVGSVRDEEEESYDNLPESQQDGERGDAMQENIDGLDEVESELEDIKDNIQEQIDNIEEQIDAIQEVIDR